MLWSLYYKYEMKEKNEKNNHCPRGEMPRRQFPLRSSTRKTAQSPCLQQHLKHTSSNTQQQDTGSSLIQLSPSKKRWHKRTDHLRLAEGYRLGYRKAVPNTSQHAPVRFHCRITERKTRKWTNIQETWPAWHVHESFDPQYTCNNPRLMILYGISLISKMNTGMCQAILKIEIMPL